MPRGARHAGRRTSVEATSQGARNGSSASRATSFHARSASSARRPIEARSAVARSMASRTAGWATRSCSSSPRPHPRTRPCRGTSGCAGSEPCERSSPELRPAARLRRCGSRHSCAGSTSARASGSRWRNLQSIVESLGHTDVETYLQSGNVVFTPKGKGDHAARLSKAIEETTGHAVAVLLRTGEELAKVVDCEPISGLRPHEGRRRVRRRGGRARSAGAG